jgi:hypothetical protein
MVAMSSGVVSADEAAGAAPKRLLPMFLSWVVGVDGGGEAQPSEGDIGPEAVVVKHKSQGSATAITNR